MGHVLRNFCYPNYAPRWTQLFRRGLLLSVNEAENHCRYDGCHNGNRHIPKEAHRHIFLSENVPTLYPYQIQQCLSIVNEPGGGSPPPVIRNFVLAQLGFQRGQTRFYALGAATLIRGFQAESFRIADAVAVSSLQSWLHHIALFVLLLRFRCPFVIAE